MGHAKLTKYPPRKSPSRVPDALQRAASARSKSEELLLCAGGCFLTHWPNGAPAQEEPGMLDLSRARARMVDVQIAARGVRDARLLEAMRRVPREAFVEPGFEEFAYEDGALPIAEGQTISQPYIVALMIEAAEVKPGDNVLEVGAGSGYAAAVMSQIADCVYGIERHASLVEVARQRFRKLGYDNIKL